MNIYKLNYIDKETAIADLIAKGVIEMFEQQQVYVNGTQAVVDIGKIATTDPTFHENGNMLTEPIYAVGYHCDIMTENDIDFGENDITDTIENPKYTFAK
jgi:hypothetical protein